MVWRPRSLRSATVAAVTACALAAACGDSDQKTDAPARSPTGATGGTGGSTGSTGGDSSAASTCSYNGVRYESGEVFGECGECICAEGGVFCTDVACPHAAGGSGGTQAGGRGNGGSSGGMNTGGTGERGGTGGMVGIPIGGAGAGGTAGIDTSPGGAGGEAGAPFECPDDPITKFCVIGDPASDGLVSLKSGMKLTLEIYPTDCSCKKVLSAACPAVRNGLALEVNRDICLEADGDQCGGECSAAQIAQCDTGATLGATSSYYTVAISGTGLSVNVQVPSVVPAEDLCATVP